MENAALRVSAPADTEPCAPPIAREFEFQFLGETGEYFRIWIVNVALTIVTLGVYSAWATVRTRRYFYANTWVADAPFEYHARPVPILIGRAIAVTLLGAYLLAGYLLPLAQIFIFLFVAVFFPLVIVKSLRFRARYSWWRNTAFHFGGGFGVAYVRFLLAYGLVIISLGLCYPLVKAWQQEYIIENHSFGGQAFRVNSLVGIFYPFYIIAALAGLALMLCWGIVLGLMMVGLSAGDALQIDGSGEMQTTLLFDITNIVMFALLYAGLGCILAYLSSRVTNAMYNNATLGAFTFNSRLQASELAWIWITNALAILFSLGLAYPWAKVRLARYRASCLTLIGTDDFDRFAAAADEHQRAIGAEIGDAFNFDISI